MNSDVQHLQELLRTPLGENGVTESQRLGDLIEHLVSTLTKYIDFPHRGLPYLIAFWITMTYCFESFQYSGYLALRSATLRCGKTRVLKLIRVFCPERPPISTNPTAAMLFRTNRKVLILDEIDRLRNKDKETYGEVLGVLNTGFEQGGTVERVEKQRAGGYEVKAYSTYGPKVFAGLESQADTLADRSFQVKMKRAAKRMPRLNVRRLEVFANELCSQVNTWVQTHTQDIQDLYDELPDEVPALREFDDRYQDIAEPLIVLATLADAERSEGTQLMPKLFEGLQEAAGQRLPSGKEQNFMALLDLMKTRLQNEEQIFIPTSELVKLCAQREELSWIDTPRRLAGLLKIFDLSPGHNTAKTVRGYTITRTWFDDWWSRYPHPLRDE